MLVNGQVDRFKEGVVLDPTLESQFRLARSHQEKQQYDEARQVLLALLHRDLGQEESREVFVELAELSLERGDFEEALEYRDRAASAIEGPAGDAALYELRGRILLSQYDATELAERDGAVLDQAIESLQYAVALDPDQQLLAGLYLDLGRAYSNREMSDVAADHLNKALALQPQDEQLLAECYKELGLIEVWDRENAERAIELFQLALKTSPLRPPSNWITFVYWSLNWAFRLSGDAGKAVKAGKKALRAANARERDHEAALFNVHYALGAAYSEIAGKEDLAIDHYLQAVSLQEDPATYHRLGNLYWNKGAIGQALEMYEEALRLGPGDYVGDIHNAVGVCRTEMDQYEEALRAFERARAEQATLSFKPYVLYRNMGLCYWHLERYEEAAEAFKTALGLMHRLDEEYQQIEWYLRQVQARQRRANK